MGAVMVGAVLIGLEEVEFDRRVKGLMHCDGSVMGLEVGGLVSWWVGELMGWSQNRQELSRYNGLGDRHSMRSIFNSRPDRISSIGL
jgi:hypothetical protein